MTRRQRRRRALKRLHPWTAVGLAGFLLAGAGCDQKAEAPGASPAVSASEPAPTDADAASVLDAVNENPEFTTFARLLSAADMADVIEARGPLTLFVPTDAAFDKLPPEERRALSQPANRDRLRALLAGHMVADRMVVAELDGAEGEAASLTTLAGNRLTVRQDDGLWRITDEAGGSAAIAMPDVIAGNGVIHAVDTVLNAN